MKKIIAFLPVWILYYLGDFISTTKVFNEGEKEWPYRMYNYCMTRSLEIQDWAQLKSPWKDSDEKDVIENKEEC